MTSRKKISFAFAFVLFFIVSAHFWGSAEGWYFSKWWFDMGIHFLGGFWLFATFLRLAHGLNPAFLVLAGAKTIFFCGMAFTAVIGGLWEVFEYVLGVAMTKDDYTLDTASDMLMDLLGGACAHLILSQKTK